MKQLFFIFNNPVDNGVVGMVLFLLLFIILFILGREIILWYFRINENTETLKEISLSLEKISAAMVFLAEDVNYKNKNQSKERINEVKNNEEMKSGQGVLKNKI